jgi:zinc protease
METSRLLLVIVGDLDPAQVRSTVAATFGKLPHGNYTEMSLPQLSFNAPSVVITDRKLQTNYVQGVFAAPPLTSPDIYPMRVASSILQDLVMEEVRNRRNLSYAPSAFLNSQGANVGGIYVTAVDANQAVSVMLDQIALLQQNRILPAGITRAASGYLTSYYLSQETNAAQAAELAEYELIGGGWRNSFETLTRLRAVTPADVQRVSQKYMRNIRFVVLGNSANVDKSVFMRQASE